MGLRHNPPERISAELGLGANWGFQPWLCASITRVLSLTGSESTFLVRAWGLP